MPIVEISRSCDGLRESDNGRMPVRKELSKSANDREDADDSPYAVAMTMQRRTKVKRPSMADQAAGRAGVRVRFNKGWTTILSYVIKEKGENGTVSCWHAARVPYEVPCVEEWVD